MDNTDRELLTLFGKYQLNIPNLEKCPLQDSWLPFFSLIVSAFLKLGHLREFPSRHILVATVFIKSN